ncbi:MAG: PLD nuclease N-terminal domain-containing protein [Actinomycetota bacterium]
MIFGGGLVGLVVLGLWIFCILDVISTDEVLVRNIPKLLWLGIVVFLPTIGSVAWLVLGRPAGAGFQIGSRVGVHRPQKRTLGPEDSPEFLGNLERRRLEDWEAQLRRREEELRRDEGGEGPAAT